MIALQAPTGGVCSSSSNRVTYWPECHAILGAIAFVTDRDPGPSNLTQGQPHPLTLPCNKCKDLSDRYLKYCFRVFGCDARGKFFGQAATNLEEVQEAVDKEEVEEATEEGEEAAIADEEERLRVESKLSAKDWPPRIIRAAIDLATKDFATKDKMAVSYTHLTLPTILRV